MDEEWCLRKVLPREEEVFDIIGVARVKAAPDSSSLLIGFTIFSKSIGVMYFSLPLLRLSVESCLRICGLDEVESKREVFAVPASSELDDSESTLDERPGA